MNVRFFLDTDGSTPLSFSPKEFADCINYLMDEKASITIRKEVSASDESLWMIKQARKRSLGDSLMVFAVPETIK